MLIRVIPENKATGKTAAMYESEVRDRGRAHDTTKVFSLRPEIFEKWQELSKAIRGTMRLRRYELVCMAALKALRCTN
ncbi:MAG: hypothetical protein FJX78_03940 [Armatimonadetes bacterium]|nr:hypothetical protein [Armatimonadota bacterium]